MSQDAILTDSQKLIAEICDEVKFMLIEKNRKYGDSALNPVRIFSKSDEIEQINVRIDDKLNRKKNQQEDEDEDVDLDLIGYLILKRAAVRLRDVPEVPVEIQQEIDELLKFDSRATIFPSWYYRELGF